MSSAGLTSWSGATEQSAVTGRWCAVPLHFAGGTAPCKPARVSHLRHPRSEKNWPRQGAATLAAPVARGARLADP